MTARRKVQIIPKATPAVAAHPHYPKKKAPYQPYLLFPFIPQSCLSPDSYDRTTQELSLVCVAEMPQIVFAS